MGHSPENEDLLQAFWDLRFFLLHWQHERTNQAARKLVEASRRFLELMNEIEANSATSDDKER